MRACVSTRFQLQTIETRSHITQFRSTAMGNCCHEYFISGCGESKADVKLLSSYTTQISLHLSQVKQKISSAYNWGAVKTK